MGPVKVTGRPLRDGYHHGDLRNALLQAALRLVAQKGPEGFSLREAAREVGVSPAAAYRHFADKLALLSDLACEAHGRLATAMERTVARVPEAPGTRAHAVASFLALGEAYVEFAVRNPEQYKVMFGPCYEVEDFRPGTAPSGRDAFQILIDTLDALVASGAIRAEARTGAELTAWSAVHGLASLIVFGALPLPARARQAATLTVGRTLLVGLGCDPAILPDAQPVPVDPRRGQAEPRPAPAARAARR
jgi:AcrR family transcriptional regulator